MVFPKTLFGRCEESGHMGADYATVSHPNAETTDAGSGTGLPLVMYKGEAICKPCKRRLENESVSLQDRHKHEREDNFRSRAGFERP